MQMDWDGPLRQFSDNCWENSPADPFCCAGFKLPNGGGGGQRSSSLTIATSHPAPLLEEQKVFHYPSLSGNIFLSLLKCRTGMPMTTHGFPPRRLPS